MRNLILSLFFVLGQSPTAPHAIIGSPLASASITVPQCVASGSFGGTSTTVSITPTNGHMLVAAVFTVSGIVNFTSVKDNNNNSFIQDNSGWSTTFYDQSYFHLSTVSGVTGVTITWGAASDYIIEVCEVAGLSSQAIDVISNTGASQTGTSWTTNAITTTNANDVVFGFDCYGTAGNTYAATSPWLLGVTRNQSGSLACGIVYQVVSSATSYTPAGTVTTSGTVGGISASYK